MSKLRFKIFILFELLIMPTFVNAQVRDVLVSHTLIEDSCEERTFNLVNDAKANTGSELKLNNSLINNRRRSEYNNYTLNYENKIYSNDKFGNIQDINLDIGYNEEINDSVNTGLDSKAEIELLDRTDEKGFVSNGDNDISLVDVNDQTDLKKSYVLYNLNYNSEDTKIDISASQELSTLFLDVTGVSKNSITQFYDDGEIINKSPINIKFCQDDACIYPEKYISENELIADYIQHDFIFNNSGRTTITAIFENGLKVKIPVWVVLFKFNSHEYNISVGENITSNIIADIDESYTFRSLNPDIAVIDQNGNISGKSSGTAFIECISENGFTTRAKVNVVNQNEISIDIDDEDIEFVEGEESIIKYFVVPNNARVSFKSSDERIVTVDNNGKLLGISTGQATIFVTVETDYEKIVKTISVSIKKRIIPVADIILNKDNVTLKANETFIVEAKVVPSDASDESLTWESSDGMVADVDSNGKITALKAGNAVVTVASNSGVSKSIRITVIEKDTDKPSIEVDKDNIELSVGDTEIIKITVVPDRELNLYSDNPSVASIDKDGKITAISSGDTTIHITTNLGEEKTVKVHVRERVPISSITLNHDRITLKENESIFVKATINPSNTTDKLDLKWMSDNSNVAIVSNSGKITAIGEGMATITVTSVNGVSSKVVVNVTKEQIPISEIEVDVDNIVLAVGDKHKINVNIKPSNTTNDRTLSWKSSDTGIALVDNNGMITAIHEGSVMITVTTSNGISHDIKVLVTKNSIPITEIKLDTKTVELEEGEFTSILAQVYPLNTTLSKKLTWVSSNLDVVKVDNDGKITALKAGNALITVTSVNSISETISVIVHKRSIPISSIKFERDNYVFYVGDLASIKAIIYPLNTTDSKILSWQVDDEDVLSVDGNGRILAKKAGITTITVTSTNGISAKVKVYVYDIKITDIKLNIHDVVLKDNKQSIKIDAYLPDDAFINNDLIEWSSSNPNVAIINNNRIIPVGYGEAFITVRYGDVSDTCRVVVPNDYKNIILGTIYDDVKKYEDGAYKNVLVNANDVLGITLNSEIQEIFDLNNKFRISWESSDENILIVNDGKIRFLKPGSASVSVSFGLYKTTLNYNVYDIEVDSTNKLITVGETTKINATIHTPTTIDKNCIFTISDSSIASIDNYGVVTGIKPGVVTIHVYSLNEAVYKTITIKVVEKEIDSYKFNVVFKDDKVVLEKDGNKVIIKLSTIKIDNNKNDFVSLNEELISHYLLSYEMGNDTSFNNPIYNVSIPVNYNKSKYSSVYISYIENGKVIKTIPSVEDNGYITFQTNHLGEFILCGILNGKDYDNSSTDNNDIINPDTGSNMVIYIICFIISTMTLILSITTKVVKKKRMNFN